MMEMVVMLDSKSSVERRVGSSPTEGTKVDEHEKARHSRSIRVH